MVAVCFYFQVHQPRRLRTYSVFDINKNEAYFDEIKNKEVMEKVARKCYLPMNTLLLKLIEQHKGAFKISFSISGTCLEQFEAYAPDVLESFKALARTGCVEFLAETYYHSLSFLYNQKEFREQVQMHAKKIHELFGQQPKVFRNTELIYNNDLPRVVERMGYSTVLTEGADHVLGWRSPNFVYKAPTSDTVKILLKNYKLSDDIAFRFGNKEWESWPLSVETYEKWISSNNGNGDVVNLFMDYETFGEHQWEDTGIFSFMEHLPEAILRHPDNSFVTVSEAAQQHDVVAEIDIPQTISWADLERDTSAWLGNKIQHVAIDECYRLGNVITQALAKTTNAEKQQELNRLLATWRYLTTSDHFYYMCTKWFSDGDVHKYFNPYDSPYEGYIAFMNVLNDLAKRIAAAIELPTFALQTPPASATTVSATTASAFPAAALYDENIARTDQLPETDEDALGYSNTLSTGSDPSPGPVESVESAEPVEYVAPVESEESVPERTPSFNLSESPSTALFAKLREQEESEAVFMQNRMKNTARQQGGEE